MMRRRSSRSKPVSMFGALLIEVGTVLAFIALAQPTWTRNLIEQVTNSPTRTSTSSVVPDALSNIPQSIELQPTPPHLALRPAVTQHTAQPVLNAPALLNTPPPAWSNTAWNSSPGNHTASFNAAANDYYTSNNIAPQGWQPSASTSPSPPWSDTTERVAQASWSAQRLPAAEDRYAPQYPVYPPSNWSNSY